VDAKQAHGHEQGSPSGVLSERARRVFRDLDPTQGHGLEVGPLYSPLVDKGQADVHYVDVHLTPALRTSYADHPGLPLDDFVEVDVALIQDGRTRSLAEATAGLAPFDWVLASHVIEHVPDVIAWLADVADVLVDDGRLVLAVPDRRYCFDVRRPPTTVGEMLLAHHHHDLRPSVRAVFDHFTTAVAITSSEAWRHVVPENEKPIHGLAYARGQVEKSVRDGEYVDCHVWLFTPSSFVEQLSVLAEMDLLDFVVDSIEPTAVDDLEFYVTLRRLPRSLSAEERAQRRAAGFPEVLAGTPALPSGIELVALTAREQRLLALKRRVGNGAKRVVRRVRRAG
jgi:SAM-dependent methyltransferase